MAKTKKKRTKRYHGTGAAAPQGPVVHHFEAVERGRFGDWWVEHKTRLRIIGIVVLVIFIIVLIVSGIISALH